MTPSPTTPTIIVDDDLGAVEVDKPANDTVRLDAEELKKKLEELEAENSEGF